jgi:hypothetical protein
MNRRPWPLVLLALLQIITPLLYLWVAAVHNNLTLGGMFDEILALETPLRKVELFVLPLILGAQIFFTRRLGYYVAVLGCLYLAVRSVLVFYATNQTDPVYVIVFSNIVSLIGVVYLARSKVRDIYFNPRLRWWETPPRYIVAWDAKLSRAGSETASVKISNLSIGGAGVDTSDTGFVPNEVVDLKFERNGQTYALRSRVVWQSKFPTMGTRLGLEWMESAMNVERVKVRRLVAELKAAKTPETRQIPSWWTDLKAWITGSSANT